MSVTDLTLESKATRWGEAIIAAAATKRPIDYIGGSTYNEKFDFLPTEHMNTSKVPVIGWIGMGIGSEYMKSITHPISREVIENPSQYIHSNGDTIPFIPLPYVLRKKGEDDLSVEERSKLSGRFEVELDGVMWIGYLFKKVEATNDRVQLSVIETNSDGELVGTKPLPPSTRPMEPSRDKNFVGEAPSSNEALQIRTPLLLSLSPSDVAEILNVAAVMFGSTNIEITEFSMIGGIEHPHIVTDGSTNISYTEVIGAQSAYFSPAKFSAAQRVDVGIDIKFMIGQTLPMA